MPREQVRRRDARQARFLAKSGAVDRKSMTDDQGKALLCGIDRGETTNLGIRQLKDLELESLVSAPPCVSWARSITLLDFASWRARDGCVRNLLNASADPSDGVLPRGALDQLPSSYAVWVSRAVARMRQLGALYGSPGTISSSGTMIKSKTGGNHPVSCSCGQVGTLMFSPCSHWCCAACVWQPFQPKAHFGHGCDQELLCPSCGAAFTDPILGFKPKRRPITKDEFGAGSWVCFLCACLNHSWRRDCLNCGSCAPGTESATCDEPEILIESQTKVSSSFSSKFVFSWSAVFVCINGVARWLRHSLSSHESSNSKSPAQLRATSYNKWLQLPLETPVDDEERMRLRASLSVHNRGTNLDSVHTAEAPRCKKMAERFRALDADSSAALKLGATRANRTERFLVAAQCGHLRRVVAILDAGVDLDATDEYGQTALFKAAWEGHADVVQVLLQWGADPHRESNGNTLPVVAASSRGHKGIKHALLKHRCNKSDVQVANSLTTCSHTQSSKACRAVKLELPASLSHEGAWTLDDVFDEGFLERLDVLWKLLPAAARQEEDNGPNALKPQMRRSVMKAETRRGDRSRQDAAHRRSYFCDAEGWVSEGFAVALQRASQMGGPPCSSGCGFEACAYMRFLHYALQGGFLAPHTDLPRTDWRTGQKSTHTFLLYLSSSDSDEGAGGETVLLESFDTPPRELAVIRPARGRLLIFPHECPHRALPVDRPPKLLLRGELRQKSVARCV